MSVNHESSNQNKSVIKRQRLFAKWHNIQENTLANNNIPVIASLNRLGTQMICKVANQQDNINIKRLPMPPKP